MFNQIPYMMANPAYTAFPAASAIASNVTPAIGAASKTAGILGKLNWSSLLSNAQKTLNVVNQAIPLYYQVKPVLGNIRTLGKIGKEFVSSSSNKQTNQNLNATKVQETNTVQESTQDIPNPTFFL
jgi:hypothetical protein